MTRYNLTSAVAGMLLVLLAGGALAATTTAHLGERFRCLLAHAPSNPHHVVTVCDPRTPEGSARLRAAGCDPAMLSDSSMRAQCAAMMSDQRTDASNNSPAG